MAERTSQRLLIGTITFLNLYALKMIYESKLLHLPVEDLGTKKKIEIIHSAPKSKKQQFGRSRTVLFQRLKSMLYLEFFRTEQT